MIMAEKIGSLEDEAMKRKERLNSLKRKRDLESNTENKNCEHTPLPKPKFRSYDPQDDTLKDNKLPSAKPSDVKAEVKDQLESANTKIIIDELDVTNLAPRKPDWDLKRDVSEKLEKLDKRTQRAIAELIRERLKQHEADLSTVVNFS